MEINNTESKISNRIFYIILTLLIIGSIVFTFYRVVVIKDYQITSEVSCDTEVEECLSAIDEETHETYYYKIISKKAASVAECEATEERLGCDEELSCVEGEEDCFYSI